MADSNFYSPESDHVTAHTLYVLLIDDRRMKLPDDEMVRILLDDPFHGAPVFVWLIGFTLSLDVVCM